MKNLTVENTNFKLYDGRRYDKIAYYEPPQDDVWCVVRLASTKKWYVVAAYDDQEEELGESGPFDTMEAALVVLKVLIAAST